MDLVHPEPELLDHLVVEFADYGRRAVEFIKTAERLLQQHGDGQVPRLPETVAYCLREAMKTIPASQDVGGGGLWRTASRKVADVRRRYGLVRGVPGEDEQGALDDLLAAIDDLELTHSQEGIHERRLIAVIVNRTGALPVAAGTAPIRAYHDLLGELDGALHGDASLDTVRLLWNRCIEILRQLFLPPEIRRSELEDLAAVENPEPVDVSRLLPLVAGPNHLRHFLGRIGSPSWLEALIDTGLLDPPVDDGPWPVFAAVDHLAANHAQAVSDWLGKIYDRHNDSTTRSRFIARAALDVGAEGSPIVLRALRDHPEEPSIAALGVRAVEAAEPAGDLVESVADVVLNGAGWRGAGLAQPVVDRLIEGMNEANAARRLQLVCWKLRAVGAEDDRRRWFSYETAGSVADWDDDGRGDRFTVLLRACIDAIRRSSPWMSATEILAIIDSVPADLRLRIRAFTMVVADQLGVDQVIQELAKAIAERDPIGDDLPLLDRVVAEADPAEYADLWTGQLGTAPPVPEVAAALADHNVPDQWRRAFHWSGVLPEEVLGAWSSPVSVMAAAYGRSTRGALEKRRSVEVGTGRSPMTTEELAAVPPIEAARMIASWRPSPSDWLVGARELARTLETVVEANTSAWLDSPLRIATELRHPTYIDHYLRALAKLAKEAETSVGEVLDVIALVRAHPWESEPLGRDDFEFDIDWRGAERASVDVLKALADADVGFAYRNDEVWAVLEAESRNRSVSSSIAGSARDPLESAINRSCTRALDAVLSFMAYEFRSTETVRLEALTLLEDSLHLDGTDGAEHRAILATRLAFLRHIAPNWMDETADLLLGSQAPEGLAQVTADLALKWGQPNAWLLEHYRPLVRDAVVREIDHALEQMLVAMLWGTPGYSVDESVAFLRESTALLSKAGEVLGRLLRHGDADDIHVERAVAFWNAAIATNQSDGLAGFGWMAEVGDLESQMWAELTLRTLAVTAGRMDWSHKVVERVLSLPPSTTGLAIMNYLVRGSSDEWDRRRNTEQAVSVLQAAGALGDTPEFERLRTTLLERGAL